MVIMVVLGNGEWLSDQVNYSIWASQRLDEGQAEQFSNPFLNKEDSDAYHWSLVVNQGYVTNKTGVSESDSKNN